MRPRLHGESEFLEPGRVDRARAGNGKAHADDERDGARSDARARWPRQRGQLYRQENWRGLQGECASRGSRCERARDCADSVQFAKLEISSWSRQLERDSRQIHH